MGAMQTKPNNEDCQRLYFRLPKREIGFVRFIVESYEGIAQVSSMPRRGEIEWIIPHSQVEAATALCAALGEEVGMVPIGKPNDWQPT